MIVIKALTIVLVFFILLPMWLYILSKSITKGKLMAYKEMIDTIIDEGGQYEKEKD